MPSSSRKTLEQIDELLDKSKLTSLYNKLKPILPEEKSLPEEVPGLRNWSQNAQNKRVELIKKIIGKEIPYITGEKHFDEIEKLRGNIENFIGFTPIPTGVIGPLRINGSEAKDDFYVPMATTEGALVASYNRGAKAASLSGGVTSMCLVETVQRTPSFKFEYFRDTGEFLIWVMEHIEQFKDIVSTKTSHGRLDDVKAHVDGNQVTLIFEYKTGDASGQNMVTICTFAICEYINDNCPKKPIKWLVEGNLSGDKKASAISFMSCRGKKVTAEAIIKKEHVANILHAQVDDIINSWNIAIINGIHSGSIGVNFHFSNCLTAIFIACGQDVATVSESSVGTTRCEKTKDGDLYICVTMPNLIVGTVGGGTWLPAQNEGLSILGCSGNNKARKFAEICAATALCGELSIMSSISAGDFARAHSLFGRKKQ
ncbi:MAG: hydroxymethylglutaryl-CoA reductase [Vampirovibrionia bacterium]